MILRHSIELRHLRLILLSTVVLCCIIPQRSYAQSNSVFFSKLDSSFNVEASRYLEQLQGKKSSGTYSLQMIIASENANNSYLEQDSVFQDCDSPFLAELLLEGMTNTKLQSPLLNQDTLIVISEYFYGVEFYSTTTLLAKTPNFYKQYRHLQNCVWEEMINQPSDLWERMHNFLTAIDYVKYIKDTRVNKAMVVYFVRGGEIEVFILISSSRGIPGFYALFDE